MRSRGVSILWSLVFGLAIQFLLPVSLALLGSPKAALLAMYPGLLPIIWATGGWFAGITPLGYVILYTINTVAYNARVRGIPIL